MYYWIIGIVAVIVVLSLFKPFQTRNNFKNKNIIITGASTGIGKELALKLAKEGINSIAIIARTKSKLDEVAAEVRKTCNNVLVVSCDVSKKEAVFQAIDQIVEKFGAPDFLITSAGLSVPGYFIQQDTTEYTMQVDFFGTLYATHRAVHHMIKKATLGIVGFSSYVPAKYAVKGLADTLLTELKPHNIRISVAYPPDTDTPGYAKEMETKPPDTKEVSNDQPTKSLLLILEDISNEFDF